jgi:hypothetical protein
MDIVGKHSEDILFFGQNVMFDFRLLFLINYNEQRTR